MNWVLVFSNTLSMMKQSNRDQIVSTLGIDVPLLTSSLLTTFLRAFPRLGSTLKQRRMWSLGVFLL